MVSLLIVFLSIPWFDASLETRDLPRKGDYDKIRTQGEKIVGVVKSVTEGHDADDDHWTVIQFGYAHDGREYHDVAYTFTIEHWAPGHPIAVRYLGDRAILPSESPANIDPRNDFQLVLGFDYFFLSPIYLLLMLGLIIYVFCELTKKPKAIFDT